MVGYAYINPLAGLSLPFPLSLSPYVIGGYAYINPLAGLTPEDYPTSERLTLDS